jgi:hypothetical protein
LRNQALHDADLLLILHETERVEGDI